MLCSDRACRLIKASLLSKCHTVSQCTNKCDFFHANNKTTGFPMPICSKRSYLQNSCTKFHPDRKINVGDMDRNLFRPLSKRWLSLYRFQEIYRQYLFVTTCSQLYPKRKKNVASEMTIYLSPEVKYDCHCTTHETRDDLLNDSVCLVCRILLKLKKKKIRKQQSFLYTSKLSLPWPPRLSQNSKLLNGITWWYIYRIKPKLENKCGRLGYNFIYACN